ncbi:MAG: hypothetical protein AB8G05_00970 [Oligoflexales bacterium]
MKMKTNFIALGRILLVSFICLASLNHYSLANERGIRALSSSSGNSCDSEKKEAKRRACEDGRNFACSAQDEIEKESREMDEGLKKYLLDQAERRIASFSNSTQENYYFFNSATITSLKGRQVNTLLPVTLFTGSLEDELRDLMNKKFDGAYIGHSGCYKTTLFPDKCELAAADEYDDWCEDGRDIVEDLAIKGSLNGPIQGQITWEETLKLIQSNNTISNSTGIWLSEKEVDTILRFSTWNAEYRNTLDAYKTVAADTYNDEFNKCPIDWSGSNRLSCHYSSSSASQLGTNPLLIGFTAFCTLYKMLK